MRKKLLGIIVWMIGVSLYAQPLVPTINLDTVWVGQVYRDTVAVVLFHESTTGFYLDSVVVLGDGHPFIVEAIDAGRWIDAGQPVRLDVRCAPRHNLWYHAVALIFTSTAEEYRAFPVRLSARCYYSDPRYRFTWNLQGNALRDALYSYLKVHRALWYSQARKILFEKITPRSGDTLECIYSGRKIIAQTYEQAYQQGFNTEHVWPRSYGSDNEPPKSDLHHLFPADQQVNERRANYPFGMVSQHVLYEQGGSKLGYNAANQLVFEVRPERRGDIARAMFYFAVRYQNPYDFLRDQEVVLRQWHWEDPVDSLERLRNDRIDSVQFRPNPFIDHPEFVERLYRIGGNADFPRLPLVRFPNSLLRFVITHSADTLWIPLVNIGTDTAVVKDAVIRGVGDTALQFQVITASAIPPASAQWIGVAVHAAAFPPLLRMDTVQVIVRFRNGLRPLKTSFVIRWKLIASVDEQGIHTAAVVAKHQQSAFVTLPTTIPRSLSPWMWDPMGRKIAVTVWRVSPRQLLIRWKHSLPAGVYWYRFPTLSKGVPVIILP